MKKLLISLLLIPLLTLTSCGEPPTVKTDFSAAFTARDGDLNYAGTVDKDGDSLTITMSEPYTVAGMVFDYDDTKLSVHYSGHSANADADYLSAHSVPGALRNALLYLSQARYVDSEDGCDVFTVDTPYGEAALTASGGMLTEVTEPHSGITFRFDERNR